jgi:hypothetical protein
MRHGVNLVLLIKIKRRIKLNDEQVEKIIKELKDIRGVMNKAYLLFWGASILLLLILIVPLL